MALSLRRKRPDHPVLEEREGEDAPVLERGAQLFVADLREGRVHHQDQPAGGPGVRRPPPERPAPLLAGGAGRGGAGTPPACPRPSKTPSSPSLGTVLKAETA